MGGCRQTGKGREEGVGEETHRGKEGGREGGRGRDWGGEGGSLEGEIANGRDCLS